MAHEAFFYPLEHIPLRNTLNSQLLYHFNKEYNKYNSSEKALLNSVRAKTRHGSCVLFSAAAKHKPIVFTIESGFNGLNGYHLRLPV